MSGHHIAAIEQSVTALRMRDQALAKEVMANDREIDASERDIEQDCLKILLMEHPVAGDFREVSAALKMITDLERIADQAADISELSLQFGEGAVHRRTGAYPADGQADHRHGEGRRARAMLNRDLAMAGDLNRRDDQVDELLETIKKDLVKMIRENPENADQALLFMMIAKYLERIGDHAVNIGEWAEYAVTGCHKIG